MHCTLLYNYHSMATVKVLLVKFKYDLRDSNYLYANIENLNGVRGHGQHELNIILYTSTSVYILSVLNEDEYICCR